MKAPKVHIINETNIFALFPDKWNNFRTIVVASHKNNCIKKN